MNRARLYAGAAVLAAACALPGTAQAQFSPCNLLGSPLPPPCIILDAGKIAQQAQEIRQKTQELQKLVDQAKEMTDIQGALGKLKAKAKAPFEGMTPLAPIADITPDQAISSFVSALPQRGASVESVTQYDGAVAEATRGTAGDGWALAQASKARLTEMDQRARTIQAVAICTVRRSSSAAAKDESLRNDWQVNTRAKTLVMQAMSSLKEVQAARIQGKAAKAFSKDYVLNAPDIERAPAPTPAPAVSSDWAIRLGSIADLSNKLSALMTAKSLFTSFKDAIAGHRETQAEYASILQAARDSESQVQRLAASDASRKRISAATLLQVANQYMSQDRTTWDDPSKTDVAKRLADSAENRMDQLVSGDVSDSWSDYLRNRAEAYKQEAFFRPISEEAKVMEQDTIKAVADYEQSLGMKIDNANVVDAEILRIQQQLGQIGNSMNGAPPEVIRQRDAIYQTTVDGAAQAQGVMQGVDATDAQAGQNPIQ